MKIAVFKELLLGEKRVAATPETVGKMVKLGFQIMIEVGAGSEASFDDQSYQTAGATITTDKALMLSTADLILKVNPPEPDEIAGMKNGAVLMSYLQPLTQFKLMQQLAQQGVSALSMELVPRITRAQRMDALSTMSTVAGYKAVLLAANASNRFFPMLTTAAGTIRPAKVIIIGVGVAGLQAIATARRLGGVVTAFDVRPAAGEQARSLGAEFVSMEVPHDAEDAGGYAREFSADFYKEEQEIIRQHSKDADVIITTALIPGRPAPILITAEMVQEMKLGSVIVDLSAEQGGNCALSQLGQTVMSHGSIVIAPENIASTMAFHASEMYARNIHAFVTLIAPNNEGIKLDLNDEVITGSLITHQGEIVHPRVQSAMTK